MKNKTIAFEMGGISPLGAVYVAYKRIMDIVADLGYGVLQVRGAAGEKGSSALLVCANIWQVLSAVLGRRLQGRKCIFWVQGLVGEESYLRHHSLPRRALLNALEYVALRLSDGYIYVSPYMKQYFEAKYAFLSARPSVILPCISTIGLGAGEGGKEPLSFCYLGGMSAWQRIRETIECMNSIVSIFPDARFHIATKDRDAASRQLERYATEALRQRTTVVSLSGDEEVGRFLGKKQFGFLLRADSVVNYVASPIKLAEYLAFGVHVIMTDNIRSYASLVEEAGAGIILSQDEMQTGGLNRKLAAMATDTAALTAASLRLHESHFSMRAGATALDVFLQEVFA